MTDTVIIRRKVKRDFTALPNDLIRDPRLTWGGLGLLVYILHLPDNFRLRLSHLSKQKASGRDATRARVKELEACGYLAITRERGSRGRFASTSWEITDEPSGSEQDIEPPRSGNPTTVNPTTDKPDTEKPTLLNTNTEQVLNKKNTNTTTTTPSDNETNAPPSLSLPARLSPHDAKAISNALLDVTAFTFFAVGCATLYLTVMGYMIGWGYVEQPLSNFLKTCLKLLFISAFALNADMYSEWIVAGLQSLQTGFAAAFAGTDASTSPDSVYQVVDSALGKGWGIAADLWERAGNRSWWSEGGTAIGEMLNAIIIAIATGLVGVPAGGMIVVAMAGLTILLGIGPFLIMALMFPVTAKFFDSWLGQAMTYILRIALVAAVMGLAFKGFDALINTVDLGNEQNPLFTSLVLITYTIVMFWLLGEMNNVARQLAGGISSAAVTLRGMASGASTPLRSAGRAINAPSTRRDMQSGMMVTGGLLNHLVAGNTMWNPAYRQHVMQNMSKNWGRAKGGKASE